MPKDRTRHSLYKSSHCRQQESVIRNQGDQESMGVGKPCNVLGFEKGYKQSVINLERPNCGCRPTKYYQRKKDYKRYVPKGPRALMRTLTKRYIKEKLDKWLRKTSSTMFEVTKGEVQNYWSIRSSVFERMTKIRRQKTFKSTNELIEKRRIQIRKESYRSLGKRIVGEEERKEI
ncbi:hypothetical protein Tco_0526505 [Tanacetum coccineum]